MSYSAQKLVNYLPSWSKSRKDPSSNTYKLMSSLNDSLSVQTIDAVKTADLFKIMGEEATHGEMVEIYLLEEDKIKTVLTGTRKGYIYPTVKGTTGVTEITLERAQNISQFLYSLPTRIEPLNSVAVSNWSIWSSASASDPADIETPERLLIEVKDSTIYYRKDTLIEEDRKAGYTSFIHLSGKDEDYRDIQETIPVRSDSCYVTRNIFKTLEEVVYDGFDGQVDVFLTSSREGLLDETFVSYKYSSGNTSTDSGPLRFYPLTESYGVVITPVINKSREDKNRLRPESKIQEEELEALCSHRMLDVTGSPANIVSIVVSPLDAYIYALTAEGKVLLYKPEYTPFVERGDKPSEDTYLDILPEVHRVDFESEIDLWTWFRVPTFRINKVSIKRVDPAGSEEYLQSDLTWAAGLYEFPGKDATNKYPEESWDDFSFPVVFDQAGQWDFYCTAYIPTLKDKVFTSKTSVMAESMTPIKEYSLEAGEEIFFDKENLLCIKQGATYKRFKMYRDLYIADPTSQRVLLKESYDDMEIYHE